MKQPTIAEIYHQSTKYLASDMAAAQTALNWDSQPASCKAYHSENKVELSPYLPLLNNPFTQEKIEASTTDEGFPVSLGAISRLLYFTNGVTGILQYPSGQSQSLRAAPTAGGLYPTEIYVATRGLSALHDGIYNFQVKDHSLVPVWEGNFWSEFKDYCLGHESISHANFIIILTAVFERSAWRYRERAYRRILLDTGHVIGNLFAYADQEGLKPFPIERFIDRSLNRLLFLDSSEEGVLFMAAVPQKANSEFCHRYALTLCDPENQPAGWTGEEAGNQHLLLKLHRASSINAEETFKPAYRDRLPQSEFVSKSSKENPLTSEWIDLVGDPIDWGTNIGATILLRRSTRNFTGNAVSKEALASVMTYATDAQRLIDPSLLETYLIIQQVKGLPPGVYRYYPEKKSICLIYAGDFRSQCWHFCLGQHLARDAAALVIHAASLKEAMQRHGNRAYRYLHLDAGYIGQGINLAAIRLGLGVSGIGGFYDDEVNHLLGLSLEKIIVYITTLGEPDGTSYV